MDILETIELYSKFVPDDIVSAVDIISYVEKSGDKEKIDALIKKRTTAKNIELIMNGEFKRGRKPVVIKNTVLDIVYLGMDPDDEYYKPMLDGIYRAVAQSFDKQSDKQKRTTIAPSKLKVLMHNDKITTEFIKSRLSIGKNQASRYMSAVKACIPLIEMKRKKVD